MAKKKLVMKPVSKSGQRQTSLRKEPGKKGGGGKLSRSQIVQVRLDPKLKFAAELASRKHRRTLSSFVEWAVEEAVAKVALGLKSKETAQEIVDKVWDVEEVDRFVKLALNYPELLTYDEEKLWKAICEYPFWVLKPDRDNWHKNPEKANLAVLRLNFSDYKDFAQGKWEDHELFFSKVMGEASGYEEKWGIK